jgi:hypothetical protein
MQIKDLEIFNEMPFLFSSGHRAAPDCRGRRALVRRASSGSRVSGTRDPQSQDSARAASKSLAPDRLIPTPDPAKKGE